MKRRTTLSFNDEDTQINLTPLIDVVFIVLIMFILVAPMVELDQVELAQGCNAAQKELQAFDGKHKVVIHVRKDNSILLNSKVIDKNNLFFLLREIHRSYPDEIPQLFHDKEASFGTYQSIKNSLEEAGFSSMDVVLNPG